MPRLDLHGIGGGKKGWVSTFNIYPPMNIAALFRTSTGSTFMIDGGNENIGYLDYGSTTAYYIYNLETGERIKTVDSPNGRPSANLFIYTIGNKRYFSNNPSNTSQTFVTDAITGSIIKVINGCITRITKIDGVYVYGIGNNTTVGNLDKLVRFNIETNTIELLSNNMHSVRYLMDDLLLVSTSNNSTYFYVNNKGENLGYDTTFKVYTYYSFPEGLAFGKRLCFYKSGGDTLYCAELTKDMKLIKSVLLSRSFSSIAEFIPSNVIESSEIVVVSTTYSYGTVEGIKYTKDGGFINGELSYSKTLKLHSGKRIATSKPFGIGRLYNLFNMNDSINTFFEIAIDNINTSGKKK